MEFVNKIIQGHTLNVLRDMPDKLVDCVITSPPYWNLRDYKTEHIVWGGDSECEHEWGKVLPPKPGAGNNPDNPIGFQQKSKAVQTGVAAQSRKSEANCGQFCQKCNAWKGQLGLEPTLDLYIEHLLQIFDETKRVMKDEGTLWINLGDSYSASGGSGSEEYSKKHTQFGKVIDQGTKVLPHRAKNIPAKSLCLIPQRFAIAMVERGWILRNVIVWKKPSCMPSSAKDRFTVDFEYIYFFVKQQKYWFEQQFDIASDSFLNDNRWKTGPTDKNMKDGYAEAMAQNPKHLHKMFEKEKPQRRNKRCVWSITIKPFSEAHFATFPPKLIEIPIKAGCPESVCKKCGKGRDKIIETKTLERYELPTDDSRYRPARYEKKYTQGARYAERTEDGVTDCGCNAGWKPGIVLDPFIGSGTVAMIAKKLKRNYVGIELNKEYCEMAEKRIRKQPVSMFG